MKFGKKLKRISSIPTTIWLSKNGNNQIPQFNGMTQDLNSNPSTCSSLVIFIYCICKRQGSIFLVLRSESSSCKCLKLHTVAASSKRDHLTRLPYYCLFALY